ncbi:MAG: H-X9-DG-CTERM domain-containing protein [Planctomycetota bacterium]
MSYAGFDVSLASGGVLADNVPADTILACDDEEDEGGPSIPGARSAKSNHEGKYNVLFLDGHVQAIPDPFAGTGGKNQMIAGKVKPLDMMKN